MYTTHPERLIIDGNNFIFRTFYTKRPEVFLDNFNTTPIHQFLYMLKVMVERFHPDEIILTWDEKLNHGGENFRKNLLAYKEQRVETEDTKKIFDTIHHIKSFTDSLGIKTIFPYNLEADDIIAFFALDSQFHDKNNIIVSSDKDLLQLISGSTIVYSPNKKIIIDNNNFTEEVGVHPSKFLLFKAIMGDVSDNISGLEKFGPVKSKILVEKLDPNVSYKESPLLTPEQIAIIDRNLAIMDLTKGYPLEQDHYQKQYDLQKELKFDADIFVELCRKYNFHNYTREIGSWRSLFGGKEEIDQSADDFDILSFISIWFIVFEY